ncbi:MAG TPA: hypothetical protein VF407_24025 [Polyangiaceae bacterium]
MNRFFALAVLASLAAGAVSIVAACDDTNDEECNDSVNVCDTNTAVVCTQIPNGTHRIRRTPCLNQSMCVYDQTGMPTCAREPADECPTGQTCANNVISTCLQIADGGWGLSDQTCEPGQICAQSDGGFVCQ